MPEFFDSPDFALTAITLRGVGSYRTAQRLEIKPLTIICGPNGSGKSTWLKAIKVLREALDEGLLPFRFGKSAEDLTNACYYNFEVGEDGEYSGDFDFDSDNEFGPPGTIGIELVATRNVKRSGSSELIGWEEDVFPKGTRIRIRIAHPRFINDTRSPLHLSEFVELEINDEIRVRFEGVVDPLQKGDIRQYPMSLYVPDRQNGATGKDARSVGNSLVHVGDFENGFERFRAAESCSFKEQYQEMFKSNYLPGPRDSDPIDDFKTEINSMLASVLDGCFLIGALRDAEASIDIEENWKRKINDNSLDRQKRYVGERGQHAWLLFHEFEGKVCRSLEETRLYLRDFHVWFGSEPNTPERTRILSFASDELRKQLLEPQLMSVGELAQTVDRLVDFLNDLVNTSELCEEDIFKPGTMGFSKFQAKKRFADPEIDVFLAIAKWHPSDPNASKLRKLSKHQVRRLNSRVIEFASMEEFDTSRRKFGVSFNELDPIMVSMRRKLAETATDTVDSAKGERDNRFDRINAKQLLVKNIIDHVRPIGNGLKDIPFRAYLNQLLSQVSEHQIGGTEMSDLSYDDAKDFADDGSFTSSNSQTFRRLIEKSRVIDYEMGGPYSENSLARVKHDCFGNVTSQVPSRFSSGFHQLMPIVLQSVVCRPFETLGIENPEVHLHPKLIRSLTSLLIQIAKSNRIVFIETHSDLLVRRVVRALLEEEIAQADTRIYFACLHRNYILRYYRDGKTLVAMEEQMIESMPESESEQLEKATFAESHLEQIRFDKHNRIINWPKGFLDEEDDEADRILDAMSQFPLADEMDDDAADNTGHKDLDSSSDEHNERDDRAEGESDE